MTGITIIHPLRETEPDYYYHRLDGQSNPEPVFLVLDTETGDLWAEIEYRSNGTPIRVWNGLNLRWEVPVLRPETMRQLLDELAPLAQRILDGAGSRWDGSNWRGTLTPDADSAADAIGDHIIFNYEYSDLDIWDAADWFDGMHDEFLERLRAGENVRKAILDISSSANGTEDAPILYGVEDYISRLENIIADIRQTFPTSA